MQARQSSAAGLRMLVKLKEVGQRTIVSGLFVAATTVTPTSSSIPSISLRIEVRMPSVCESPSEREVQRASISSWQQERIEAGESDDGAARDTRGKSETHEEDDRWGSGAGFAEHLSHGAFRLSDVLVQKLENETRKKSAYRTRLSCHCEREEGRTSGPLTAKKLIPLSVASAFAVSVLLHPGGP